MGPIPCSEDGIEEGAVHSVDRPSTAKIPLATIPNPPKETDVGLGVGMANKPPASAPTTSAYNSSPAQQSSMEEEDADRMDRYRESGVRGSVVYPTLEELLDTTGPDCNHSPP
ncbi:hypothetical protein evm_011002 [Chilo suppressalis]|nr:hypothetical protein evm_011002 [Chilo suppressalis]